MSSAVSKLEGIVFIQTHTNSRNSNTCHIKLHIFCIFLLWQKPHGVWLCSIYSTKNTHYPNFNSSL